MVEVFDLAHDIHLPLNVNDVDLEPSMGEVPRPRQCLTDMSFFLAILELVQLTSELKLLKTSSTSTETSLGVSNQYQKVVKGFVSRFEHDFLRHCDTSRATDWHLMLTSKSMLVSSDPSQRSYACGHYSR